MGKDKVKDTPPPVQTTPGAPPICPGDIGVTDCKSAVVFSDKTPSFFTATSTADAAANRAKANPADRGAARAAAAAAGNLHCDFKAVWTYVPPPPTDQLSVLIYYHGNDNWVRVDSDGNCVLPDWWQDGDPIGARTSRTAPPTVAKSCAPKRYDLAAAAEANQKPIVLVPEDTNPVQHTPTAEANPDKPALGAFIEDCFQHLSDASLLKKHSSCSGGAYLPKKPALTEIKRLFISGHSGGGLPLFRAAISDVAISRPTDLCLLDCTYGWRSIDHLNYIEFCKAKKASLGNAAGQSRLLCFYLGFPIRDEETAKRTIRTQLEQENTKNQKFNDDLPATNARRAAHVPPLPPLPPKPIVDITDALLHTKWQQQWLNSTKQHAEDDIIAGLKRAGFKFDTSLPPPATGKGDAIQIATGSFPDIETACSSYPIVFVAVSGVEHDSFPNRFIPVMLKTAKVV